MNNSIYENFYLACQQTVFKYLSFRDIFYLACQRTVYQQVVLIQVTLTWILLPYYTDREGRIFNTNLYKDCQIWTILELLCFINNTVSS